MKILNVRDAEFKAYGKVVEGLDVSSLLKALEETPKPDDVIYVASDESWKPVIVLRKLHTACSAECPSR